MPAVWSVFLLCFLCWQRQWTRFIWPGASLHQLRWFPSLSIPILVLSRLKIKRYRAQELLTIYPILRHGNFCLPNHQRHMLLLSTLPPQWVCRLTFPCLLNPEVFFILSSNFVASCDKRSWHVSVPTCISGVCLGASPLALWCKTVTQSLNSSYSDRDLLTRPCERSMEVDKSVFWKCHGYKSKSSLLLNNNGHTDKMQLLRLVFQPGEY